MRRCAGTRAEPLRASTRKRSIRGAAAGSAAGARLRLSLGQPARRAVRPVNAANRRSGRRRRRRRRLRRAGGAGVPARRASSARPAPGRRTGGGRTVAVEIAAHIRRALDRERYGGSRPAQPSFGGGGGGTWRWQSPQNGGNRDRNRQRWPSAAGRPPAGPRRRGHRSVTYSRATLVERAVVGSAARARGDAARRAGTQVAPTGPETVSSDSGLDASRRSPSLTRCRGRERTGQADAQAAATTAKKTTAKSAPAAEQTAETRPAAPAKRTTRPARAPSPRRPAPPRPRRPPEAASATEAKKPTRRRTTKSAPPAEEG